MSSRIALTAMRELSFFAEGARCVYPLPVCSVRRGSSAPAAREKRLCRAALTLAKKRGRWYNGGMNMQQLLSPLRRAVEDFGMISEGDRIAVGLSGGKDSTALVAALAAFSRFSPNPFELCAVTIDAGAGADYTPLTAFCESLGVKHIIEKTDIYEIVFNVRKESNPCSLCAKMRRGALASVMGREGCNKLALGHHADDVAETLVMSMIYEGRLNTFKPVSYMSRTGVTVIRPFVYADEKDIAALVKEQGMPVVKNPCPADSDSRRCYIKQLLRTLDRENGFIASGNIKRAIFHPERNSLWSVPSRNDGEEKKRE